MHRLFLEEHKMGLTSIASGDMEPAGWAIWGTIFTTNIFIYFEILYSVNVAPINFNLKGFYEHEGWGEMHGTGKAVSQQ